MIPGFRPGPSAPLHNKDHMNMLVVTCEVAMHFDPPLHYSSRIIVQCRSPDTTAIGVVNKSCVTCDEKKLFLSP